MPKADSFDATIRSVASASDDADGESRVVVKAVHGIRQAAADRGVHRILGLRPIDGDDQDPVALLDQDYIFAVVCHAGDRNDRGLRHSA